MDKTNISNVVITTSSFGVQDALPLQILKSRGFDVIVNPYGRVLKEQEVSDLLRDLNPVGLIAGTEPLNAAVLDQTDRLRVISRVGTGMDNVDLHYAARRGIHVASTPLATLLPVSELTIGLMLDLLRRVSYMDRQIRQGQWKKHTGALLHGRKVGIVGAGRIGKKVAELVQHFGAAVSVYDLSPDRSWALAHDITVIDSVKDIFADSDVVTLHLSGGVHSKHLVDANLLATARQGLLLVNLSRGEVVNESDLIVALRSGRIGGAALDVFEREPYQGELIEFDNVILTPHIGSATKESRIAMERAAVDNLLQVLEQTQ